MPARRPNRRRKRSGVGDTMLGLLIPAFLLALASYQQVTSGAVDKYVIGGLMVFGLAFLGYRVDTFIEKYLEIRAGIADVTGSEEEEPPPEEGAE